MKPVCLVKPCRIMFANCRPVIELASQIIFKKFLKLNYKNIKKPWIQFLENCISEFLKFLKEFWTSELKNNSKSLNVESEVFWAVSWIYSRILPCSCGIILFYHFVTSSCVCMDSRTAVFWTKLFLASGAVSNLILELLSIISAVK